MGDWSVQDAVPSQPTLHLFSEESLGVELANLGGAFGIVSSAVWPTANRAVYVPFTVGTFTTVVKMFTYVITQNGNLDLGIYDSNQNRLVSTGSTAVGAAGIQIVDVTDTVLAPGCYYFALACSSGTAKFAGTGTVSTTSGFVILDLEALGVYSQASALALPATATFATPAASTYVPFVGAMLRTTL